MARMKFEKNLDNHVYVDEYMKVFRAAVWERYRNDEFELQDKREETVDIMKQELSSFNLDEPFIINTTVEFEKYNFKKEKFEMNPFGENIFFNSRKCCFKVFSNEYRVFFNNGNLIDGLPMPKDKAKNFLNSRKGYGGSVDRRVYARIEFKLTKLQNDKEFMSQIINLSLFADRNHSKLLYEYSL